MTEYKDDEVAALALIACECRQRRIAKTDIIHRAGAILDKLVLFGDVDSILIDLNIFTEYSRSQDRKKAGARRKIRQVLEAAGAEITKTTRGKFVATMRCKR